MGLLARLVSRINLPNSIIARAKMGQESVPGGSGTAAVAVVGPSGFWPMVSNMIGWSGDTFTGTWQRGQDRTAASMLMFSAVYACTSIISGDVAKIGIRVLRTDDKGGLEEQNTHPLARILRVPNHYQTRVDFWQSFMVSLLLAGNTYVLVEFDGANRPMAWYVLDPRRVRPLVSEDGAVFYDVETDFLAGVQQSVRIPARYIIHHRLMTVGHPLIGVTPLYAGAISAAMGLKILTSSDAFFKQMARPSGMLTAPGKISKETAITLQKHWEENYSGANAGKVAVAGDGLEFKAITMNAVDSQLAEQLRFSVEDVARCFRVPGFMLGDLSKVSYKNSETLARAYYSGCLQYHFEAIESRLDTFFGLPLGTETRFILEDLLRTELDVRFKSYQVALNSGFMTINEARAREDLPAVEGGDEPLVQMQYRPLSQAVKEPDPSATPTPPPSDTPPADPAGDPPPDDSSNAGMNNDDPEDDDEEAAMAEFAERMAA